MPISLGTTTIAAIYLGTTSISSAYLGNTQVFGGFSPLDLFSGGAQGIWLDPSDLTTMFQDTAGTVPVTTAGQTVARVNDKSGGGNNATQATAASRPAYSIMPSGGRRNFLTYSEDFRNTAAAGEARPWTLDNSGATNPTVTADFGTAPNGTTTADRIQLDKTGGTFSRVQQVLSGLTNGIYTFSVWLMNNAGGTVNVGIRVEGTAANCAVTSTWQRFSVTLSAAGTSASAQIMLFDSIAGNDETADILAWGAQVDAGSTATAYQKVTTRYNVTEVGKASMSCLSFDGVDDFLVTPTITPGVDKAQVFAGVGKLSDAATSILAEHSVNSASNAGTFIVTAPNNISSSGNYGMYSRGSTAPAAAANSAITLAPVINVLAGIGDIAGDVQRIRLNGAGEVTNTNDQGTGNYLAHPIYIGRRGGTTLPFNGNVYSLIVRFGANLTAGQITDAETWVAGKTGVTL